MKSPVTKDELPQSGTVPRFEGYRFGDVATSFFLNETRPGGGARLHRHPYAEVVVVQEGQLAFTVDDAEIVATADQIVIVPAGAVHKFVDSGEGPARHVDIHAGTRMITEWLEDDGDAR